LVAAAPNQSKSNQIKSLGVGREERNQNKKGEKRRAVE
jgi:hypothetical protein